MRRLTRSWLSRGSPPWTTGGRAVGTREPTTRLLPGSGVGSLLYGLAGHVARPPFFPGGRKGRLSCATVPAPGDRYADKHQSKPNLPDTKRKSGAVTAPGLRCEDAHRSDLGGRSRRVRRRRRRCRIGRGCGRWRTRWRGLLLLGRLGRHTRVWLVRRGGTRCTGRSDAGLDGRRPKRADQDEADQHQRADSYQGVRRAKPRA